MQNNQRAFKDYQNYRQFRGNPLWLPLQLSGFQIPNCGIIGIGSVKVA